MAKTSVPWWSAKRYCAEAMFDFTVHCSLFVAVRCRFHRTGTGRQRRVSLLRVLEKEDFIVSIVPGLKMSPFSKEAEAESAIMPYGTRTRTYIATLRVAAETDSAVRID
jgi:hypothetical protein